MNLVHASVMRLLTGLISLVVTVLSVGTTWAGGSGLDVIVVVNQNSTNSLQLGNFYCEQRGVPPQNVLRMTGWTNGAVYWSLSDFQTFLQDPLLAMLVSRGLTNQAEFVLLSMDIPYTVSDGDSYNSTTAALFYGFQTNTAAPLPPWCLPPTCSLPDASSNSYAFSELPFPEALPDAASTNSFLTMMLTQSNLAGAGLVLARGVVSDSTFPTQAVYLAKSTDAVRNVRFVGFDNAIFSSRVRGDYSLVWTNTDSTWFTDLLGLLTGRVDVLMPTNTFSPGAMADSLTSYGGVIFDNSDGQSTLLAFLDAGATGSYGTIKEPCNYPQKFPNPLDYFYQNRGFCLAESYYQSLQNPYQGLLVGEPLSAPFARRGTAAWSALTNGAVLTGSPELNVTFAAAATNLPLAKVDLFLDGTCIQTVTNLLPSAGNLLSATVNGFTVSYAVPANATVASVATGLTAALNAQTNSTRVQARAVGDRVELQSLAVTVPGSNVTLTAKATAGAAKQLTTQLSAARLTSLDTPATGYLTVLASNTPALGDWLQLSFTKTNGAQVTVSTTNSAPDGTIAALLFSLLDLVNTNPALQSADGVVAADFSDDTYCGIVAAQFTLYARSPGWPASQIQVAFTASPNLLALPSGTNSLQDNLNDLRPRNHLYVSSGVTSLAAAWTLDTTRFPDGYHQLTAVASEGTSVRTQTSVARNVRIQNTKLSAAFTSLLAGTNATLDMPLQFQVKASAGGVARIELFSTGGSVGVSSNQASVLFTVPSADLGLGLHPFYALVTGTTGKQYQTQTIWIRLIPSLVLLSISTPPPTLCWPAIPGQDFEVLATTNLARPFQTVTSLVATSMVVHWPIPTPASNLSFYRVRSSP